MVVFLASRQSSCGVAQCRSLHIVFLGYWFPEGSHVPRSEEDSCNLLHDKHPLSDSPATLKAKSRTCADQTPSVSSQDHNGLCPLKARTTQSRTHPSLAPMYAWLRRRLGSRCTSASWSNLETIILDPAEPRAKGPAGGSSTRIPRNWTHLAARLLCTEEVTTDDQLQSFIVNTQPLITISVIC